MRPLITLVVIVVTGFFSLKAQTVTVLSIDTQGLNLDPSQMGNLLRIELEKLGKFQVTDRYDVAYLIQQRGLDVSKCFGKICLTEIGKALDSDKMLGGSIERISQKIIVNLRWIDVKTASIEKSYTREFLDLPTELPLIASISLREMLDLPTEADLVKKITVVDTYESRINNPQVERLKLNGPRMGFTVFTGELAARLQEPKNKGGFEAYPVMFQFGYQFETQYLNEGNFQGLFEFIPLITGLDQGLIIPSFTLLHGMRNNRNGLEFAFGPTFSIVPMAKGYFDAQNQWQLLGKQDESQVPFEIEQRLDSRSNEYMLRGGFLIGLGKSFRSGNLNIPVNVYCIPSAEGIRFGASFGFNAKKKSF